MKSIRLAILDMNNGVENQGMRCITAIVHRYRYVLDYRAFDVRAKGQVPALADYDIFVCSGGPGDPRKQGADWEAPFYALVDAIRDHNARGEAPPKFAFFICHSFQMVTNHWELGRLHERRSMSFGTFPVHMTAAGQIDPVFGGLSDPFWVADFRSYQVTEPDRAELDALGAEVLAIEKERPHVPLDRAMMAIRFTPEMVGTQFHPEADAAGMLKHFQKPEKMVAIINEYGKEKYAQMINDLRRPDLIEHTNRTVLPGFLDRAVDTLKELALAR